MMLTEHDLAQTLDWRHGGSALPGVPHLGAEATALPSWPPPLH